MKKLIIGVLILIAAVLIFIVIKGKQSAYGKAEAKAAMSQKFIEMTATATGWSARKSLTQPPKRKLLTRKWILRRNWKNSTNLWPIPGKTATSTMTIICLPKNLRHKDKETAKNFPEKK